MAQRKAHGVMGVIGAQLSVGTAVTVSGALVGFPICSVQAVRYTIGTALLATGAKAAGHYPPRPRGRGGCGSRR